MLTYIGRRTLAALLLIVVTSFVVFALEHLSPGGPEAVLLGSRPATPALLTEIRNNYHLNDPFFVQYWHWLSGAARGYFGQSITYKGDVSSVLANRMGVTLELGLYAGVIAFIVGLVVGVVSALRRDGIFDTGAQAVTLFLASVSNYVWAIILLVVFAATLGWFPVIGTGTGLVDRAYHLTLPAIAMALSLIALVARTTRSSMSVALDQEFVETVRARGLSDMRAVVKHALRSALIPVLTIGGLVVGYLISGAVLVEYTFGLNGLGSLLVSTVEAKDYAVVQAVTLLFTTTFIVLNLIVDLLYGLVDPRVRLGEAAVS